MKPQRTRVFGIAFVGILIALPTMLGSLRVSGRIIVTADDVVAEDLYAFGDATIIEGVVDGDLFVVTGNLDISGSVTGDVVGLVGGPAHISGSVGGSVRLAVVDLDISGSVADDVAVVAAETGIGGAVGRDLLAIAGSLGLDGSVGRDVRAQVYRMSIGGAVARDVSLRTDRLSIGPAASVGGDILYQATDDAAVSPGAVVEGRFTRTEVIAPVWAKAVTRLFAILSLFGFVTAGLVISWVFRGLAGGAVVTVREQPFRSLLTGLVVLVVPPLLVVPLFLTLVGIPIALLILLAWLCALFLGPLPAVTALGARMLRSRDAGAGALVVGTLVWRGAMWLLPLVAALLYLTVLLLGLGAYASAAWNLRSQHQAT